MNKFTLALLIIVSTLIARPKKKVVNENEIQLQALKAQLEAVRDSLQNEIAERWRTKQKYIGQRELDKEELVRLRDTQERAFLDLSRVKEECFSRERSIADEQSLLQQKRDGWRFVSTAIDETFEKEGKKVIEMFPLDREERRLELENNRRTFKENSRIVSALNNFVNYKLKYISIGTQTGITKQTVIPEEGEAQHLSIARFGNVFGYGMNPENIPYIIRQTGRLGISRYTIEKISEPVLSQSMCNAFPSWIDKNSPHGNILIDVLQNAQSGALISGEKIGTTAKAKEYVKAGGPVMVPLLLLPIWALILILIKLVQFAVKHRTGTNLSVHTLAELEKGDISKAREYVKKKKGIVAKVVATCLDHSDWERDAAEKAVKGIIVEEVPQLNKHLSTLAVLAGVAPLMGLLGTVTGMINLFDVITHYGTGDPKIMAGGISEALITTQTGLSIAIPILLIHNYLRNRRDRIIAEMEKHTIQILNKLWPTDNKK